VKTGHHRLRGVAFDDDRLNVHGAVRHPYAHAEQQQRGGQQTRIRDDGQ